MQHETQLIKNVLNQSDRPLTGKVIASKIREGGYGIDASTVNRTLHLNKDIFLLDKSSGKNMWTLPIQRNETDPFPIQRHQPVSPSFVPSFAKPLYSPHKNYKSILNEISQKNGKFPPVYETFQHGPDSRNIMNFTTYVRYVDCTVTGDPKNNKKDAEQSAAKNLLEWKGWLK